LNFVPAIGNDCVGGNHAKVADPDVVEVPEMHVVADGCAIVDEYPLFVSIDASKTVPVASPHFEILSQAGRSQ
jgi:hypothetical protein